LSSLVNEANHVLDNGVRCGVAILRGERAVSADTALRLARFFGTSASFWLGLQMDHDLEAARAALGERLEREVTPRAA
jgi:plasmid maintenance system antidote protein VapI